MPPVGAVWVSASRMVAGRRVGHPQVGGQRDAVREDGGEHAVGDPQPVPFDQPLDGEGDRDDQHGDAGRCSPAKLISTSGAWSVPLAMSCSSAGGGAVREAGDGQHHGDAEHARAGSAAGRRAGAPGRRAAARRRPPRSVCSLTGGSPAGVRPGRAARDGVRRRPGADFSGGAPAGFGGSVRIGVGRARCPGRVVSSGMSASEASAAGRDGRRPPGRGRVPPGVLSAPAAGSPGGGPERLVRLRAAALRPSNVDLVSPSHRPEDGGTDQAPMRSRAGISPKPSPNRHPDPDPRGGRTVGGVRQDGAPVPRRTRRSRGDGKDRGTGERGTAEVVDADRPAGADGEPDGPEELPAYAERVLDRRRAASRPDG